MRGRPDTHGELDGYSGSCSNATRGPTLAHNIAEIARIFCQRKRETGCVLPILGVHSSQNRYSETSILCRGFSDKGEEGTNDRVGRTGGQQVIYLFVVS